MDRHQTPSGLVHLHQPPPTPPTPPQTHFKDLICCLLLSPFNPILGLARAASAWLISFSGHFLRLQLDIRFPPLPPPSHIGGGFRESQRGLILHASLRLSTLIHIQPGWLTGWVGVGGVVEDRVWFKPSVKRMRNRVCLRLSLSLSLSATFPPGTWDFYFFCGRSVLSVSLNEFASGSDADAHFFN